MDPLLQEYYIDKARTESLKRKYNLRHCWVTSYHKDYGILKKNLGKCASQLFETVIQEYEFPRVGIGGGSTLYEMVMHCESRPRQIKLYPTALVGRGPEIEFIDSCFLVTTLYLKSRPLAHGYVVGVPPLPNDKSKCSSFYFNLVQDVPEIGILLSWVRNADILFVGLGSMIPIGDIGNEMAKMGMSLQDLQNMGVIGGINYNWFDTKGQQVGDFFLTVTVSDLRRLARNHEKTVVLIAGGHHKISAVRIALEYGFCNSLVTDEDIAKFLLEDKEL